MAHFANLDTNNMVIQVIVVNNNVILDENNQESEAIGISFCKSLFGENTEWKQASYNKNFRANFPAPGDIYDTNNDVFYEQQPFPSWSLDTTDWLWKAPIDCPDDPENIILHYWSEELYNYNNNYGWINVEHDIEYNEDTNTWQQWNNDTSEWIDIPSN